jgi:GR25 family glycosyltransferase involved in LPS biosynthesis
MNRLNIYIITSKHLTIRKKYLGNNIEHLKKIIQDTGITIKVFMINDYEYTTIESSLNDYNKRINYDVIKDSDSDFLNHNKKLNINQLSNIEKHRKAYDLIRNNNDDVLHLILEDDILLSTDYNDNISLLFRAIKKFQKWDIIFTCVANNNDELIKLIDSRENFKILISKSSYLITSDAASKLYDYFNVLNYQLKIGLSKFIFDNKDIKSFILNKHTFLEGSKIGLFLSSTNTNNFLYQNSDFVTLSSYVNKSSISKDDIFTVENIYKNNQLNNNADFQHSLGLIYYKYGDYKTAKKYLVESVTNIKKNEGLIGNFSEILNNCINMHQYDQPDIEECSKKPSKY